MKKLMIIAAIVCAAIVSHAASLNWGSQGVQIDGDFDGADGNMANKFTVYLINADVYSQSDIIKGVTSAKDGAALATYLDSVKADVAVTGEGGYNVGGVFTKSLDVGEATAYNALLVILDANTAAKANYAFVSDTYAASFNTVGGSFEYDAENFVNALDYSIAGQEGSNWTKVGAVPEPTSGLLLLLGVAGLALKRKRA